MNLPWLTILLLLPILGSVVLVLLPARALRGTCTSSSPSASRW